MSETSFSMPILSILSQLRQWFTAFKKKKFPSYGSATSHALVSTQIGGSVFVLKGRRKLAGGERSVTTGTALD